MKSSMTRSTHTGMIVKHKRFFRIKFETGYQDLSYGTKYDR